MKNLFLSIFLFFGWSINSYSQNLENLDLKYGFNKFKLESSFQNYQEDLEYFKTLDNGVKLYRYTKRDINIFGFSDIQQINLGFYKNKLYTIDISMGVLTFLNDDEMYSTIFVKLVELFGSPNQTSPGDSEKGLEDINQWVTKKTGLGLEKNLCSSIVRPCTVNIFLISQVIQRQINNDGF